MRRKFLIALAIALTGCQTSTPPTHDLALDGLGDIRITIIGDAQLTTEKLKGDYWYRSRFADGLENVSIRTPAVEYLANENLRNTLLSITSSSSDVILYLGDGANSGCKDEVDDFFDTLALARSITRVPIYFAIGNHDYLGTGNQTAVSARSQLCGESPYYEKKQLIEKTAAFNKVSFAQFNDGLFKSYKDSVETSTQHCERPVRRLFRGLPQHRKGCFYAAYLTFEREGAQGDLMVVDSSDYMNLTFNPRLGSKIEAYGVRGAISFADRGAMTNQVDWLLKQAERVPAVRVLASHYPLDALRWKLLGITLSKKSGRAGSLLLGSGENLWLSAHTHTDSPKSEFPLPVTFTGVELEPSERYVAEANVGSTTDYPGHFMTVRRDETRGGNVVKQVTYLPGYAEPESCREINQAIESFAAPASAYGTNRGPAALGMTTHYQVPLLWNRTQESEQARDNLSAFLQQYGEWAPDNDGRAKAVSCIMVASSKLESEAGFTTRLKHFFGELVANSEP